MSEPCPKIFSHFFLSQNSQKINQSSYVHIRKETHIIFFFISAWLITTLVILLIYLCTRCCDTKSTKHRKSRPIRCLLSFFALVTAAGLAGGFWGNHVLHGGMEDFQKATEDIVTKVRHIQEMSKRYNEALQVKFVNFNFPIFTEGASGI